MKPLRAALLISMLAGLATPTMAKAEINSCLASFSGTKARAIVVLDAAALMRDPELIFRFPQHEVVIPMSTLQQLGQIASKAADASSRRQGAKLAADRIAQVLDEARDKGKVDVANRGVPLPGGAILRIPQTRPNNSTTLHSENPALTAAHQLLESEANRNVTLVAGESHVRAIAAAMNVPTMSLAQAAGRDIEEAEQYTGYRKIQLDPAIIAEFASHKELNPNQLPLNVALRPNEFVVMDSTGTDGAHEIGRFDKVKNKIVWVDRNLSLLGIHPRNDEQAMLADMIMNPEILVIVLNSQAGTGKTLLAVAGGLAQILQLHRYGQFIYLRSTVETGNSMGFLPGDISEKTDPFTQPAKDQLKVMLEVDGPDSLARFMNGHRDDREANKNKKGKKNSPVSRIQLVFNRFIEFLPLNFLRGQTLRNSFILVDEGSAFSPSQMRTVLNRIDGKSKVIVAGDVNQIDNESLSPNYNGITAVQQVIGRDSDIGYLVMSKVERGRITEIGNRIIP